MSKVPEFNSVFKDRLFYGQWQYSLTFDLDEVNAIKTLNHDHIDMIIARRMAWRIATHNKWVNQGNIYRKINPIQDETIEKLHKLTDILLNTKIKFQLVTSINHAWIYTNNKKLIAEICRSIEIARIKCLTVVIDRPANTIKLKNPKHLYRTYFKNMKMTKSAKENLDNFLKNQASDIRIGPGLSVWVLNPWLYCQEHFFIDHSSDDYLLMLSLICPGLIRKTIDIIPA